MKKTSILVLAAALTVGAPLGCAQKKSRSVTLEGPEKKYELKIEKTDKNGSDEK